MSTPVIYKLRAPEAPWGDYGHILTHGMSAHLSRTDKGLLSLERTGPYIPPITFPGLNIVVTDELRRSLDTSGLTGFTFRPVHMARIVRLDWHLWDKSAAEPPEYGEDSEPENYILDRMHSESLAKQMSPLWELVAVKEVVAVRVPSGKNALRRKDIPSTDFFGLGDYVSPNARNWFEEHLGKHVDFASVEIIDS